MQYTGTASPITKQILPATLAEYNTYVSSFTNASNPDRTVNPGFYPEDLVWTTPTTASLLYTASGNNIAGTAIKPTNTTKVGVSGMQSFSRVGNIILTTLATRIGTWVANWNGSQTTLNSLRASNDLQFDMWNQKLEEFKNISTKNLANEIGKGQRTIQIDELILNTQHSL